MVIKRCIGCMEEIESYPCPHCGCSMEDGQKNLLALRPESILNGKYLIGKSLGQGGFGITYIGLDLSLGVKVAIKEFFPSGQVSRHPSAGSTLLWNTTEQVQKFKADGIDAFLKEARKMARVDSVPEVVRVREIFRENDTAYIVMDFVEGETLKDRLARTGPMDWEEAKRIFFPAIRGMAAVHRAGLIHRDLSPDNLMIQPDGGVKILDLGASKDVSANSGASSMLVAKSGFSPLEQYIQRGGSGPWTDVYAMAATIYYSLTGVLLAPAMDRMDDDRTNWNLPGLQQLPAGVVAALQKALVINAKGRTQSMEELLDQLEHGWRAPAAEVPKAAPAIAEAPKAAPVKAEAPKAVPVKAEAPKAAPAAANVSRADPIFNAPPVRAAGPAAQNPPEKPAMSRFEARQKKSLERNQRALKVAVPIILVIVLIGVIFAFISILSPKAPATMGTFDTGSELGGFWGQSQYLRGLIKKVEFHDSVRIAPGNAWDVSAKKDYSVRAWVEGTTLHVAGDGKIALGENASNMFCNFQKLERINFNDCVQTKGVKNMSYMFFNCKSLGTLDISFFDTSNVTNMNNMFYGTQITHLNLGPFDVSNVVISTYFMPKGTTIDEQPWEEYFKK